MCKECTCGLYQRPDAPEPADPVVDATADAGSQVTQAEPDATAPPADPDDDPTTVH
jgi:hypothetical protein